MPSWIASMRSQATLKKYCVVIAIGLLVLLAYGPSFRAGFIWDDDVHVTGNAQMRDFQGFFRIWTTPEAVYYPLTSTFFWIETHLWGNKPFGYHLFNLIVHIANSFLVYLILQSFFEFFIAFFAALLFAVHPIQVESVAWITELKNLLSAFFCLMSALFYLLYSGTMTRGRGKRYLAALFFFILAVLSKSQVVMLPVVFLFFHWFKKDKPLPGQLKALAPFFLISLLASCWTIWEQTFHSGAFGNDWTAPFLERLLRSAHILWFYAAKIAFPHPLMFLYPKWTTDVHSFRSYFPLFLLMLTTLFLTLLRKKIAPRVLFCLLYFAVMLFPFLGFFNIYFMKYSFVGDHFVYHAGLGLMVVFACFINGIRKPKTLKWFMMALTVLVLTGMTYVHALTFRSSETLWRDTANKNPRAWLAFHNLATVLYSRWDVMGAIRNYELALKIRPDFAEAHSNLSYLLASTHQGDLAIAHGLAAIRLQPNSAASHLNLGIAFHESGDIKNAEEQYKKAISLSPGLDAAYADLADLWAPQNRKEALRWLKAGLHQNPNSPLLRGKLHRILEEQEIQDRSA